MSRGLSERTMQSGLGRSYGFTVPTWLCRNILFFSLGMVSIWPFLQQPYDKNVNSLPFQSFSRQTPTKDLHVQRELSPTKRNQFRSHFVIQDFARRVLSRHIVSSNVLVIGRDVQRTSSKEGNLNSKDISEELSIGAIFAANAIAEGHTVHALETNGKFAIDEWWQSFNCSSIEKSHLWSSSAGTSRPNWILAALFDAPFGQQDSIWRPSEKFMHESTVTYVVLAIHSLLSNDGTIKMDGILAAKALAQRRYKLQVLLLSHYQTKDFEECDELFEKYGPNAMLKQPKDVEDLLRWGAEAAVHYGGAKTPFTAYLFATQGLDLAIPSQLIYLTDTGQAKNADCRKRLYADNFMQLKPCPQSTLSQTLDITFDTRDGELALLVRMLTNGTQQDQVVFHSKSPLTSKFVKTSINEAQVKTENVEQTKVNLWHNGETIASSEAACVKMYERSKCTTRVLPENFVTQSNGKQPNILLVLIDPISRRFFERSMPLTGKVLREFNFTNFSNYSVVGGNSGPNQAALYSGIPLSRRDGISKESGRMWLWDRLRRSGYKTLKAEDGCIENSNMIQSLKPNTTHGKALDKLFCFDFDRPNCIGPDLASTHLINYGEQFIKAYQGFTPWAGFMHFVDTHEDAMILSISLDLQLHKFLNSLYRDTKFHNMFIVFCSDHGLHYGPYIQTQPGKKERVQPILYIRIPDSLQSKTKMHSLSSNSKLWTTPFDVHETILEVSGTNKEDVDAQKTRRGYSLLQPLPETRKSCVGTLDIPNEFCTFSDAATMKENQCKKPPRTPLVSSFFADILVENRPKLKNVCFGSEEQLLSSPSPSRKCSCATSHRDWHTCAKHPWGNDGIRSLNQPEEYFSITKCHNKTISIDTRILRQEALAFPIPTNRMATGPENSPNILVLELNSVSNEYANRHFPLSTNFLNLHRLKKDEDEKLHCLGRICVADFDLFGLVGPNLLANQIVIMSGCLVSKFHDDCLDANYTTLMDACSEGGMFTSSSGKNCRNCPEGTQLKDPLASCRGSTYDCCTSEFARWNVTRVCRNSNRLENGLQLFFHGPGRYSTWCPKSHRSSLLMDIAKDQGYVTFFGEETCYNSSMQAGKDKVLSVHADIELRNLYCQARKQMGGSFWEERLTKCSERQTLSGRSFNPGMDQIMGMWDAYTKVPKFAYMNTFAGQFFETSWIETISRSERYDSQLYEFLVEMVHHEEFSNTIIILHSGQVAHRGSKILDYSFQTEHQDSWTRIIFPKTSRWVSLRAVTENQNKLASSFDLHRTIRELLEGTRVDTAIDSEHVLPKWSFNLLKSAIPRNRTCKDAKISIDFCPCDDHIERPRELEIYE